MNLKSLMKLCIIFTLTVSCSSDDNSDQNSQTDLHIGVWKRIATQDQDGVVIDNTSTCNLTEFTETTYVITDYTDANCTIEFSSGSLPYTRIDDLIYFGEVSADIYVEIVTLTATTLKLKQDYQQGDNPMFDIVTYTKQ